MSTRFEAIAAPSPERFRAALVQFWVTAAVLCATRAQEGGPAWARPLAARLAADIQGAVSQMNMALLWEETPPSVILAVYVEMLWVCHLYGQAVPPELAGISREELGQFFAAEPAEGTSDQGVRDIEIVKGSIEKIFDKLPKPLRKLFEALMEVLKLSRGMG